MDDITLETEPITERCLENLLKRLIAIVPDSKITFTKNSDDGAYLLKTRIGNSQYTCRIEAQQSYIAGDHSWHLEWQIYYLRITRNDKILTIDNPYAERETKNLTRNAGGAGRVFEAYSNEKGQRFYGYFSTVRSTYEYYKRVRDDTYRSLIGRSLNWGMFGVIHDLYNSILNENISRNEKIKEIKKNQEMERLIEAKKARKEQELKRKREEEQNSFEVENDLI